MSQREKPFINGELYHIYNRGVDKRNIFSNIFDLDRFFQSMEEFNTINPIGSIYENSFRKSKLKGLIPKNRLVDFICYCLNPNHYHFILKQRIDRGIEKFMHRLSTGYTRYFNEKHKRNGVLFQGRFKAKYISSNDYLLHLNAYINLNTQIHLPKLGGSTSKLYKSSWDEYIGKNREKFCEKQIILNQFESKQVHKQFALDSLDSILEKRKNDEELNNLLLES